MIIFYFLLLIITSSINAQIHNTTTTPSSSHFLQETTKPPAKTVLDSADIPSLAVQQTSYHDPSGKVSCSISIADDTSHLQLSGDDFGYPKFMVDDEFRQNKLATQMFNMYLRKDVGGSPDGQINLHLENTNRITEQHGPVNSQRAPVGSQQSAPVNPFLNQGNPGPDIFGNQQFHQQSPFHNSVVFPKTQNNGFRGFDFSSPISNTKDKASIVANGFHFPSGGIPIFRKKRMAGFETTFTGFKKPSYLCQSQLVLLRRYKGYGAKCFVLEPEIQNINIATCSNQKCSSCNDFSGVTQCSAEVKDTWVWSYCEGLNQGQKVVYDKIKIPTHCACKTFQC